MNCRVTEGFLYNFVVDYDKQQEKLIFSPKQSSLYLGKDNLPIELQTNDEIIKVWRIIDKSSDNETTIVIAWNFQSKLFKETLLSPYIENTKILINDNEPLLSTFVVNHEVLDFFLKYFSSKEKTEKEDIVVSKEPVKMNFKIDIDENYKIKNAISSYLYFVGIAIIVIALITGFICFFASSGYRMEYLVSTGFGIIIGGIITGILYIGLGKAIKLLEELQKSVNKKYDNLYNLIKNISKK